MKLISHWAATFALACLATAHHASAEIRPAPCFSSNMILQRDVPARLAGYADEGEKVTVKIGNRVVAETMGKGEKQPWIVSLPVLKVGPVPDITLEGKNTVTLTNLLAGDVWVCSGQSNMEMSLQAGPWCKYGGVLNVDREVAAASHPQIRLFTALAKKPWMVCEPENAKSFSASGYFFGRELQQQLKVPIGLLQAAVGGTPAEYWTPRSAREAWPDFAPALESAKKTLEKLKPQFDADRLAMTAWSKAAEEARKNGQPAPERPKPKLTSSEEERVRAAIHVNTVGSGYASRIKPLTTMTIKGVIWYQGEGNVGREQEYTELMAQLIGGWRAEWGQGDFPFLIMQLVNFGGDGNWPALRAAQATVADSVPNTGMAVGIDIGDPKNIHPANKQEVGRRLALVALKQVYGRDMVASGPKLSGARIEAGKVVLSFDPGGKEQQLVLKPGEATGFEVAGEDGKFQPAAAQLQANTITLAVPAVQKPCAVRYAWDANPPAVLFNTFGLPAMPFYQGNFK